MRSAAHGHAKRATVSRYKCTRIEIFSCRNYKSKPACLHRHGARETSGILNINSPTFLTPSQELVVLNKLSEKKVGVTGHFENFFSKNRFFLYKTYKNTQAVWSTFRRWNAKKFEPRLPETVWTWFQTKNWDVYVQKSKWRSHLKSTGTLSRSIWKVWCVVASELWERHARCRCRCFMYQAKRI